MNSLFILLFLIPAVTFSAKNKQDVKKLEMKEIYLRQVDYRQKMSKKFSIPVGINFNLRASFEYRFRFNQAQQSEKVKDFLKK